MSKLTLSEFLYKDILQDSLLHEQYKRLLTAYTNLILGARTEVLDDGFISLLRYADLLSNSNDERHQNFAQQIVILMEQIFPRDSYVKALKESIYRNVSNFANIALMKQGQKSESEFSFLDDLAYFTHKELNRLNDKQDIFLLDTQKALIAEITENKFFSFSGPTSMGKTFVIQNYIKNQLMTDVKQNFTIIVPTRALLTEIANKFIKDFGELLAEKRYNVISSVSAIKDERNFIAILTPERLYYSFLKTPNIKFNQVFIDEAHKISGKDRRSILYYKILDIIKTNEPETRVYFSSPVIINPDIYLDLTNFFKSEKSSDRTFLFSPVLQNKLYIDISDKSVKIYNNLSNKLENSNVKINYENKMQALMDLGRGKNNLIYVSSPYKAVECANEFYAEYEQPEVDISDKKRLEKAAKKIEAAIHRDYYLAKLVRKGIAYHIGSLPAQIRLLIESLIRDGLIKFCFCTSTLLEGVNVPVDNLFIYSHKKGNAKMSEIDAFNLMGRAGRVMLNEFGNVFLLIEDDQYKNFFITVLLEPLPKQELLPQEALKKKHKTAIVNRLLQGKTHLLEVGEKYSDQGFNETTYEYATSCLNILLHDLCTYNESFVVKSFRKDNLLTPQNIIEIRKIFGAVVKKDDDINISALQKKVLYDAVRNTDIDYPREFDYEQCVAFLGRLSEIFKWDIYERSTLGRGRSINFYSVLLMQWIQGEGLHNIIWRALEYYDRTKSKVEVYKPTRDFIPFNGSLEHKNKVINETLKELEQVINHKLSMYFLRFSEAIIEVRGREALTNDWYDFVEYGTSDKLLIFLQKHGLTRELAIDIQKGFLQYIIAQENSFSISGDILNIENEELAEALLIVSINFPEIFHNEIEVEE